MLNLDTLIIGFDRGLRTLFAPAQSVRAVPGADQPEAELSEAEKRLSAALMRVNHSGEICAQAMYQGQALVVRDETIRNALEQASREETEHLAWTARRIDELGGRESLLNPLWYTGSLAIGAVAGMLGDKWNLGFLAETERQVERHLEGHLQRLPSHDERSRAIIMQMKIDEAGHATTAIHHGAAELPAPVRFAMTLSARVMTGVAHWV